MTELIVPEVTFNWRPAFDERSLEFPVRAAIPERPARRNKLWRTAPVLDQGREGACVGFAWAHEALSTPVAVDLSRVKADVPREPNAFARSVYHIAKTLDPWPGEDYSGTSVHAGAKALRGFGIVREYRWCFNIEDVIDAVLVKGPVVLGIYWHKGMYTAPGGILRVSGPIVGGHAITAVGFRLAAQSRTGQDAIVLQNSWGPDWGINGLAEIPVGDLASLLHNDGEACIPTRRSYGR